MPSQASAPKAEEARRSRVYLYFKANLSSVLPAAAALLLILAISLPIAESRRGCSPFSRVEDQGGGIMSRVNPITCHDATPLRELIGEIAKEESDKTYYRSPPLIRIRGGTGGIDAETRGVTEYKLPPAVEATRRATQKHAVAEVAKTMGDASATLSQAQALQKFYEMRQTAGANTAEGNRVTRGTTTRRTQKQPRRPRANAAAGKAAAPEKNETSRPNINTAPQEDITKALASSKKDAMLAENQIAEAEIKLSKVRTLAVTENNTLMNIALLREAQARVRWVSSAALLFSVAIGTLCAMAWIFFLAAGDHLWPSGLQKIPGKRFWVLIALLIGSVIGVGLIVFPGYWAIDALFPGEINWLAPLQVEFFGQDNSLKTTLFGSKTEITDSLGFIVFIAVLTIMVAATTILYQHPEQLESRLPVVKSPSRPGIDPQPGKYYDEFLARCFQRLTVAIYFAGALLVVCVIRIGAEYGWLSALLDPVTPVKDEAGKPSLSVALTALSDQLTFEYGLIFSLVLISLFLPAWIVLRRRAWQVVRTRRAGEADRTLETDKVWLKERGLSFTNFQYWAQLSALLAPFSTGAVLTVVKGLLGN